MRGSHHRNGGIFRAGKLKHSWSSCPDRSPKACDFIKHQDLRMHVAPQAERKGKKKKKKKSRSAPRNFQTSNTSSVNHSFSIPNSWTPYLTITYRLAPPENRSLLVHWVITHNWGITRDWLDLKETQTCVRRMHLRSMMRWTQDLEPIWGGVGCYSSKHHFSETFSRWKRYSCEVRTKILMTHCQQVSRCQ